MSRKKKLEAPAADEPGLVVTALIDVSFLLLIFFLVTSTLDKREADLDIVLPGTGGGIPGMVFEINIGPQGDITLFDEPLDFDAASRELPLLRKRLRDYKKAHEIIGESPLVLVRADDEANGQRFVDVLNCLAEVGIKRVTLPGFKES